MFEVKQILLCLANKKDVPNNAYTLLSEEKDIPEAEFAIRYFHKNKTMPSEAILRRQFKSFDRFAKEGGSLEYWVGEYDKIKQKMEVQRKLEESQKAFKAGDVDKAEDIMAKSVRVSNQVTNLASVEMSKQPLIKQDFFPNIAMRKDEITFLVGRMKEGKTLLLMALNFLAIQQGYKTLFVSVEQGASGIKEKAELLMKHKPFSKVDLRKFHFIRAVNLHRLPNINKFDFGFVDSFYLLGGQGQLWERIFTNMQTLIQLKEDSGIGFIGTSQVNRNKELFDVNVSYSDAIAQGVDHLLGVKAYKALKIMRCETIVSRTSDPAINHFNWNPADFSSGFGKIDISQIAPEQMGEVDLSEAQ